MHGDRQVDQQVTTLLHRACAISRPLHGCSEPEGRSRLPAGHSAALALDWYFLCPAILLGCCL